MGETQEEDHMAMMKTYEQPSEIFLRPEIDITLIPLSVRREVR